MKVYLLFILVVFWVPHSIEALANCLLHKDGEVIPDRRSCSSYYVCINGKGLKRHCARGLYFDVHSGSCNLAYLVDCAASRFGKGFLKNDPPCEEHTTPKPCTTTPKPCTTTPKPCITTTPTPCKSTTTTPPLSDPTTTTPSSGPTTTPSSGPTTTPTTTCRTTTKTCSHSTPTPKPCTTTTTCRTTTTCLPSHISHIGNNAHGSHSELKYLASSRDCANLADGTMLLDKRHCRRYYVCTNKRAKIHRCHIGSWFDRKTHTCRYRKDVTNCVAGRN